MLSLWWFLRGALSRALLLLGFVGMGAGVLLIHHDHRLIRNQPREVYLALFVGGVGCFVAGSELRKG
jgi:hypothetical protein